MLKGHDISNLQGQIDWSLFGRYRPDFVWAKASQGQWYSDPYFASNWRMLGQLGIPRLAYGFGEPARSNGIADALKFLTVAGAGVSGDIPILDLEDLPPGDPQLRPTDDLLAYTRDWLNTVEATWGVSPLIYSRVGFLQAHNCTGHVELARYGLALAAYETFQFPIPPAPWPVLAFWQVGQGPVPGVATPVDIQLFNGTLDELRRYGKP